MRALPQFLLAARMHVFGIVCIFMSDNASQKRFYKFVSGGIVPNSSPTAWHCLLRCCASTTESMRLDTRRFCMHSNCHLYLLSDFAALILLFFASIVSFSALRMKDKSMRKFMWKDQAALSDSGESQKDSFPLQTV